MAEKSTLQKLQEESSADVMTMIYEKINSLLGAGNQLFAMEFPARPLNGKNYEYATDDSYSVLTKPYTVQEQEFLLSDAMYDVSPIVQGTNGEKLSTVYTTVLNNFVPRLEALKSFVHDQKNLRRWLLEEVTEELGGVRKTLSRMAMAKELYREYLEKRNAWYSEKDKEYNESKAGTGEKDLDSYARWVSSVGLVKEEELNNYFNDAIVRGHYHEVLTLLGFLNVASPAEVLEQTKQKMRASIRRSLDGSSDIYPVQFQPSDWFKGLRPNISPKDLTMATDSLLAEYRAKQSRLLSLHSQLAEQSIIEIPPERQAQLEAQIKTYEDDLAKEELNMIEKYGQGAFSAVKAVINIYKELADPLTKVNDMIEKVKKAPDVSLFGPQERRIYGLVENVSLDAINSVTATFKGQQEVRKKLQQLSGARMAYSEAKVKDMRLQKLRIEEQIKSVQADLDFLAPLISGSISEIEKAAPGNETVPDVSLMTEAAEENEDNNFMDVIIKSDEKGSMSSGNSALSGTESGLNVGGWFWSGGRNINQTTGSEDQKKLDMQKKLEIGFRVKKVSIERGGWFNANIFKLSDNYFRLADIRFSSGLHKDQVQSIFSLGLDVTSKLKELVTYPGNDNKTLNYVLPAFPTGFVIAKDITIRIQSDESESNSSRSYMENHSSSSGGIFGFRGNSGSSSKSQSESAYFGSSERYFYIRIPGPQILGWFLEFTPADNADPYKELDPELYAQALESLMNEDEHGGSDK